MTAPRWALSVSGGAYHAIDAQGAGSPVGIYVALCGHRLAVVAKLHERPSGQVCPECYRLACNGSDAPSPPE